MITKMTMSNSSNRCLWWCSSNRCNSRCMRNRNKKRKSTLRIRKRRNSTILGSNLTKKRYFKNNPRLREGIQISGSSNQSNNNLILNKIHNNSNIMNKNKNKLMITMSSTKKTMNRRKTCLNKCRRILDDHFTEITLISNFDI